MNNEHNDRPQVVMTSILSLILLFSLGCAAKKQIAFAHAGAVYARALDSVLTRSEVAAVDATSERLLQDDELSNQTVDSYTRLSAIDHERIEITERLRKHARLLARYFQALDQLADSKAPDQAEQSIDGVATQLNALGEQLRKSPLISNAAILSKPTNFAVAQIRNKMLREELAKRHDALDRELATEEALIAALSRAIQHDADLTQQNREQRLVIDPLVSPAPIANPDAWITARRDVLLGSKRIAELDAAADAIHSLRNAFDELSSGKGNRTTIRSLLSDAEEMLSSAK